MPRGRLEKVDRQLVRGITGLKQTGNGRVEQSTSGILQPAGVLIANVTLYSTENEEKSSVVERWNRTMKNMWKYFTANNTQKYIDVLPGIVEKYNNTYHRSMKLKPTDAPQASKL